MSEIRQLEDEFNKEILSLLKIWLEECDYKAPIFRKMVGRYGGYKTTKKLIMDLNPSYGFLKLYRMGRLDLTVEAVIGDSKWQELFTEQEKNRAKEKLDKYQYIGQVEKDKSEI